MTCTSTITGGIARYHPVPPPFSVPGLPQIRLPVPKVSWSASRLTAVRRNSGPHDRPADDPFVDRLKARFAAELPEMLKLDL